MVRPAGRRRTLVAATAAAALAAGTFGSLTFVQERNAERLPWKAHELYEQMKGEQDPGEKTFQTSSQGVENGGAGGEAFEARTAAEQFAQHRGIVPAGAYSAALQQITGLGDPVLSAPWKELTGTPYNSDDPNYRDYFSNSSGGSGNTTGRITGIATLGKTVFAGGADGGVWRSTTGGGHWTPIADELGTLSTGDLRVGPDKALWYATGEGNTGGTSFVGQGVYRDADPTSKDFKTTDRVGGTELESTTIQKIRFGGDFAWVATNRGIWRHSVAGSMATPWEPVFAPNPTYLSGSGSKDAQDPQAGYKNIVNDIAVDPKNAQHVIAAVGWRGGDSYNGFYESTQRGAAGSWHKVNLKGGIDSIDPSDVGQATFGFSDDGSKLYAVVQSVKLYSKNTGTVNSYLKGVYVSNSGSVAGPWTKIADQTKLANSGSALKQSVGGKGYGPGIQSWYNQFLGVDPKDPKHVYVGLEEVYETRDGGATWKTVGPYWNFYFKCYDAGAFTLTNGCNATTHSDQHSVAFGENADGAPTVYVGNDGGIYSRPVNGHEDREGHATDWKSLNDGSIDALQYYSVGVGDDPEADGSVAVSGGLQDNGGSLLRLALTNPSDAANPGKTVFSSNFGGDGGDVLVDPTDGCKIVQEYVDLSMRATDNCAKSTSKDAFVDASAANTKDIAPPETNARFIAPFDQDRSNANDWIAAGQHVWFQTKGFDIRTADNPSKVWQNKLDLATFLPAHGQKDAKAPVATAVALNGNKAAVAWCGPCSEAFVGGVVVTEDITKDTPDWTNVGTKDDVAARYIGGVAVDGDSVYAVTGGFSRRFTDGPGAGVQHVWKIGLADHSLTPLDRSGKAGAFPDVPANTVKMTDLGLVVGTDLGVFVQGTDGAWQNLAAGLPKATVMDVEVHGDYLYAATHGRGIWRVKIS
ncbi:MAG: WD40/YVTN/BNR-like repeat-containing protein [Motilibacteraceae bacterium]